MLINSGGAQGVLLLGVAAQEVLQQNEKIFLPAWRGEGVDEFPKVAPFRA